MTKPQKNAQRTVPARGSHPKPPPVLRLAGLVAALCGALLGLALLKFVNPPIMEKFVDAPADVFEWGINAWPVWIGHGLFLVLAIMGAFAARQPKGLPKWLVWLPLVWLGWQLISATHTESWELSKPTIIHFGVCAAFFYLGLLVLSQVRTWVFGLGIMAAFAVVIGVGFDQHFGGLEASRKYWLTYIYPMHPEMPPDMVAGLTKKMSTTRIFSTLFYPNTLAQVILMVLPLSLGIIWSAQERFTIGARGFLMSVFGAGSLACLFWSGSKSGWLLLLVIGVTGAWFLPVKRQIKMAILVIVLALGTAGFMARNLGYFKKGATSVVARYDYWHAATETFFEKPVFGNGPGTFGKAYERRKKPESEMARMTHNDYLEQASDSGAIGCVAFTAMVAGVLIYTYRHGRLKEDWTRLGIWLGLLGWALQSFVEFGLYVPAVAWLAFALMGWLLGQCRSSGFPIHRAV